MSDQSDYVRDIAFVLGFALLAYGVFDTWGAGIAAMVCGTILVILSIIGTLTR